jgi:endonuclease IV
VKASQGRLISCTAAAKWMGDNKVVFHSGFYSKNHVEKINDVVQKAMNEIVEFIKSFE